MRPLVLEECTVEVLAEMDSMPVRGNAMASGDAAFDKEVEDGIISRLTDGDVWAWADVEVRLTYNELSASTRLGGCSYANEADFRACDYFKAMQQEALELLNEKLRNLQRPD